jgi:hypothetical protein
MYVLVGNGKFEVEKLAIKKWQKKLETTCTGNKNVSMGQCNVSKWQKKVIHALSLCMHIKIHVHVQYMYNCQ